MQNSVFPDPEPQDNIIGVDKGALLCLEKGISLTTAVGDFDSITFNQKARLKSITKDIREFDSKKDETDAEIALKIAVTDRDVESVVIYNWTGGRIDHMLSVLYMVYQPKFLKAIDRISLINETNTIRFYKPGDYTLLKELGKEYLSFIGMTSLSKLTLKGVKYPIENVSYTYPRALISNEFSEKQCQICFNEGLLAVIQSSDK